MNKIRRNINLDLIRSLAVFFVISIHFFVNNGFYDAIITRDRMMITTYISGERLIIMAYMRTFFMVCVPLFLLLTGYLMNKKKLNLKYYLSIRKIIVIYILASICCLTYRSIHLNEVISFIDALKSIINFSGAQYAWYINMYIGLFLIIPFLNLIYWNLTNRKQKHVLIVTLLFISIAPQWWNSLYPITYYFLGVYLSEYKFKISSIKNLFMIIASVIIFGTINILVSQEKLFVWGNFNGWGSLQSVVTSLLVFILILNLNVEKLPQLLKKIIIKISELSLGIYLVSSIFDNYFYEILFVKQPIMSLRLEWYFVIVPVVFIFSIILSQFLEWIAKLTLNYIDKILIRKKPLD